jgi:hypothetical protein
MDLHNQQEPVQCFKLVAVDSEGRYVSIYDGTTEYKVGETIAQEVRAGVTVFLKKKKCLHVCACAYRQAVRHTICG